MARTPEIPTSAEALQQLVLEQQAVLDAHQATIEEKQATIEANQATIDANQATIHEQAQLIDLFREWKRLIDSQRFGSRSERLVPEQGYLFNEAEVEAASAEDEEGDAIAVPAYARKKPRRRPLPDFLPIQEIVHDLSEAEKVCAHDPDHRLVEIGRESSDQLKFIPATVEIVRHIRPKYGCPTCREGVKIAPMPKLPITARSIA